MIEFTEDTLTAEQAFWVMYYVLEKNHELSLGSFGITDILSASSPFEFDERGHMDGKYLGERRIAPMDHGMISFWTEAIERYKIEGKPSVGELKK